MQPTGREVSREGYDDVRRSGRQARQSQQVLDAIRQGGPCTRQRIAELTGLALSSVCGRCRELLDTGQLTVVGTAGKPARQILAYVPEEANDAPRGDLLDECTEVAQP
ncbi:hypothetical protein QWY79_10330 [Halomonas sabkhae]|uniref:hypothetical protein n=1 Tax=Halomonas sabkhae TaxID=626223 RepID=UPI0025B55940|nr:hypothetical protein [Halomonas sabkhae]MDN3525660.1 hypothetical protein [Halomonas sabkhae]